MHGFLRTRFSGSSRAFCSIEEDDASILWQDTEICIVIRCMALIFGAKDIDEIAYNDIGILTCLDFLFLL